MNKKVLYVLNVFNRDIDLKIHLTLLKKHFKENIILAVVCNGNIKATGLENIFIKYNNRGHHTGTIDSWDEAAKIFNSSEADIMVWAHAKSWWTNFDETEKILNKFEESNKRLCLIDISPLGALNSEKHHGYWCDWIAIKKDLLNKVGIMAEGYDIKNWAECHIEDKIKHLLSSNDTLTISAITPIHQNGHPCTAMPPYDKIFKNINDNEKCHILAHYNIDTKKEILKSNNIEYYELVKDIK